MKDRVWGSGIILFILFFGLFTGIKIFTVIMTLVGLISLKELIDIKYEKKKIIYIKTISYVFLGLLLFNNVFYNINNMVLLLSLMLCLIFSVVFYNDRNKYSIDDALYFLGIVLIIGISFMSIINMRIDSIYKCIYIFIISFITDTYAYLGGMLIGKHTFTNISPKKTIEGSIIGALMGTFFGSVYYYATIGDLNIIGIIVMSFVLTIFGEFGDLVFSFIKRCFNKKDFANLIPGHGGILDRFDSVIFVSLGLLLISILC